MEKDKKLPNPKSVHVFKGSSPEESVAKLNEFLDEYRFIPERIVPFAIEKTAYLLVTFK